MEQFQIDELNYFNLPHLLKCEDKNSMRNSIETRLPYLDYRLIEFLVSLDPSSKLKNANLKYLLKKISKNIVPDKILKRKKKFGFEAPSNMWITQNKIEMLDKIKNSKVINSIYKINYKNLHDKRLLWRFYNITIWESIFNVVVKE